MIDRTHPAGITTGKVIVDGNEVNSPPRQGVENDGGDGGKSLALTGLLFGDFPLMKSDAGHELDVEGTHLQGANGSFTGEGKDLGQDVIEVGSAFKLIFGFLYLGFQLAVFK